MYENTGPRAHEMAAELISFGIDAHAVYRQLYEGIPQGKERCYSGHIAFRGRKATFGKRAKSPLFC